MTPSVARRSSVTSSPLTSPAGYSVTARGPPTSGPCARGGPTRERSSPPVHTGDGPECDVSGGEWMSVGERSDVRGELSGVGEKQSDGGAG